MKHTIKLGVAFLLVFFLLTSARSQKKNPIFGTWKIINGKHSGSPAPQSVMDRIQLFNKDNTFRSIVTNSNGAKSDYNWGIFSVINDTTIVAYQLDPSGKMINNGNTYNFHVKNDTMHYYGFYLRQLPTIKQHY